MGHATERSGREHATERPGRVLDMGMLQSGLGGVLPRTPCHAASYPRSQPPLNDERFWLGWLHQIEMMDGGANSLKAAKNEFVSTRDIVYAYLVNQCAMTMATTKGMKSWAWAASLNGDGRNVGLCLVWATGNSSEDQETPLGHPFPWEGWWPCAVITSDSLIWVFYCPPMAWARQKAWHVHQSRLLLHDNLCNLRTRAGGRAAATEHGNRAGDRAGDRAGSALDGVSKEPETEPETDSVQPAACCCSMMPSRMAGSVHEPSVLVSKAPLHVGGPAVANEKSGVDKCMMAVGTWSPRSEVETRICVDDEIEVEWKQPDAEGGFWAWGCVHPAAGTPRSPRWGYFPLSCVPPSSPVDEYHF